MEIHDFVELVEGSIKGGAAEDLCRFADEFAAIGNNKRILTDAINDGLRDMRQFMALNSDSSRTFSLTTGTKAAIRANVWMPDPRYESLAEGATVDDVYHYLLPHDHIQSFMTVGYLGPGYRTRIYEYEERFPESGKRVDLRFLEETTLPTSKIMVYRASRDVHVQFPPKDMSISLNFMLIEPNVIYPPQCFFDISGSRIADISHGLQPQVNSLFSIAAQLGDARTVDILLELGLRHDHRQVRDGAFKAMIALDPERANELADLGAEAIGKAPC